MMEPPPQGEVEDTLKRINSHPGVLGLLVINPQGIAISDVIPDVIQRDVCSCQHAFSFPRTNLLRVGPTTYISIKIAVSQC